MDCPNCGTWNPDDKKVCWRCQTPLPTPKPEKPKRQMPTFMGLPIWLFFLILILFFSPLLLGRCAPFFMG
ncbi:MAG TPA: hypothetical protein ENK60_07025 [Anaerolineae bacterium]|nr:hypothetical protein [Anaerolineae bacterium]